MPYDIVNKTLESVVATVRDQLQVADDISFEPANPKFGADFALPCFGLAAELKKNPAELAKQITKTLQDQPELARVEAVGGFVNIWFNDAILSDIVGQTITLGSDFGMQKTYTGQQIVVEHTDPNPFKEFHIGHTYSNTIGEALGRLYKAGGADVHQVWYYGDVGMHIAKAIWGIQELLKSDDGPWFEPDSNPTNRTLAAVSADKRVAFLGAAYVHGSQAFEASIESQEIIKAINKHIYDHDDELIDEIRDTGKVWSLEYFDDIYKRLHVIFERGYPESEVTEEGVQIVRDNIGRVFEESDGAIVYHGKTADLHTRVFINNRGLPTYEAKDIGLIYAKQRDYPDMTIAHVITGNEQSMYYQVVIAAVREINADLAAKMRHTGHGLVKLSGGRKMSSRTGQVVRGVDVLDQLQQIIRDNYQTSEVEAVMLGALKYTYLKSRIGGDIVFDLQESVNLEGNSGPYIQYAHARGRSILAKLPADTHAVERIAAFTPDERLLAAKIMAYNTAVAKAVTDLAPHHICTYLYELTQQFNRFYEKNRIIDDPRQSERATLITAYCQVLRNGLTLLNIPAPERL